MIENTWFYTTNLKNKREYQETLLSNQKGQLADKNYILSGSVGVGKTTQAILAVRDYIETTTKEQSFWHYSFEPFFIDFGEYCQTLNDQRFGDEEAKTRAYYLLKDLAESPFVILDDLRTVFGSAFEKTTVDNALLGLLSKFYANRKTQRLILTTNSSKEDIQKNYSEATCSRLFGMCEYLPIIGGDKRLNN